MSIKGFVFFSDITAQQQEIMNSVSELKYQFSTWSETTETGLDSSFVTLQGLQKSGKGYSATLRISVGGLLGEPVGSRKGAYGRLNVSPEDTLYDCFSNIYNVSSEWPTDERGNFVLEKGSGVSLPVLRIARGLLYIGINTEMVKSSAEVEDSSYYRIEEIEYVGDVTFTLNGGIKRTKYFGASTGSSVNAKAPAPATQGFTQKEKPVNVL